MPGTSRRRRGEWFAGVWKGRLDLLANTCNSNVDESLFTSLTLNQDGTTVVVDSPTAATYTGTADGERLIVEKSEASECDDGNGTLTTRLDLGRIVAIDSALATVFIDSECGIFQCRISYVGNVERTIQ